MKSFQRIYSAVEAVGEDLRAEGFKSFSISLSADIISIFLTTAKQSDIRELAQKLHRALYFKDRECNTYKTEYYFHYFGVKIYAIE